MSSTRPAPRFLTPPARTFRKRRRVRFLTPCAVRFARLATSTTPVRFRSRFLIRRPSACRASCVDRFRFRRAVHSRRAHPVPFQAARDAASEIATADNFAELRSNPIVIQKPASKFDVGFWCSCGTQLSGVRSLIRRSGRGRPTILLSAISRHFQICEGQTTFICDSLDSRVRSRT